MSPRYISLFPVSSCFSSNEIEELSRLYGLNESYL
jgi:hypothetical protein